MSESTDRQLQEADAAIERAVAAFMSAINRMMRRWDYVSSQYILEGVLLKLCEELTKRIDKGHPRIGPETLNKLANALADYRDPRGEDRG